MLTFRLPEFLDGTYIPLLKLSKTVVDRLAADSVDIVFWETALPGFGVHIKPSGAKSYVVQYRNRASGRSRRKTIGRHGPLLSLLEARGIARGYLSDVLRVGDPAARSRDERTTPTVNTLAEHYLDKHAAPKKRPGSVKNDMSMLARFILPSLANRQVSEVKHQDVQILHNGMRETPYQANRTLSLLSKMFELSVRWGWRTDNPARGAEKFHEENRYRWLSDAELSRLTDALDRYPNQLAASAIQLQLLTGARIGEVLTATWEDFDLDRCVRNKPSHHTKQKRTEHLPLSGATQDFLLRIRDVSDGESEYLFPGRNSLRPLTDLKRFWKSILSTAEIEEYRMHDNRHTHARIWFQVE